MARGKCRTGITSAAPHGSYFSYRIVWNSGTVHWLAPDTWEYSDRFVAVSRVAAEPPHTADRWVHHIRSKFRWEARFLPLVVLALSSLPGLVIKPSNGRSGPLMLSCLRTLWPSAGGLGVCACGAHTQRLEILNT